MMEKGRAADEKRLGKYTLIKDEEDPRLEMFNKPLPCFGCGIGWFSFLLGFALPFLWYYAAILFISNYYQKDPRERSGLAASATAALPYSSGALGFFIPKKLDTVNMTVSINKQ